MTGWRILLDCGHEIALGGKLSADKTSPGRPLYCGTCREQRKLVEYGEAVR